MKEILKKVIKTKSGNIIFKSLIAAPILVIGLGGAFLMWFGAKDEI